MKISGFFIPNSLQNSLDLWLLNYRPLSKMITLGIPNLQTMFLQKKCCILASIITAKGSASTHFVKYSISTSKNIICFLLSGNGPTISILHVQNGQGEEMHVKCSTRTCCTFPNRGICYTFE